MHNGSLVRIVEKFLYDSGAAFPFDISPRRPGGSPCNVERFFKLMISRGFAEELVNFGRRVVRRRSVNPTDAVTIELITRTKLQPSHTVRVDADEMQAVRGHLNRKLLHGPAITASEQRCLSALFGQEVRCRDRQHPVRVWRSLDIVYRIGSA
jgi:hypothetical protein